MVSRNVSPILTKLLLVEGNDDKRFFEALTRHLGETGITVEIYGGKVNLGNRLVNLAGRLNTLVDPSIGIVRDADESAASAFDSVIGSLRRAGLPTPNEPATPTEGDGLRVSVLILPPNESTGELEDVCLGSIEGTPDLECVESYLACIRNAGPPIADNRRAKAKIHAYLAGGPLPQFFTGASHESTGRRQPGLRLGEAADSRVWNWSSPAFAPLIGFVRNL